MIDPKESLKPVQVQDLIAREHDPAAVQLLQPEDEMEWDLLKEPDFIKGLHWGFPRYGHPEGKVLLHVREVLDNIEKLDLEVKIRQKMRLIAIVHDTFKFLEDKGEARDWSRHHGLLARQFLEKRVDNKLVLDIIELHDEAYYIWCLKFYHQQIASAHHRLNLLQRRFGDNLQYYYLFFKCDTRTGDKNQTPLRWFESTMTGISFVDF